MTIKDVREKLNKNDVRWILCAFTDVRGIFQSFSSPVENFMEDDRYFTDGIGFDGSSIRGFKSIEQSDMIFYPDQNAVYVLPWTSGVQKTAVIIGDIREPFGSKEASDCDPRGYVAKRAAKKAESMGYIWMFPRKAAATVLIMDAVMLTIKVVATKR